jgi:hypothetical protein
MQGRSSHRAIAQESLVVRFLTDLAGDSSSRYVATLMLNLADRRFGGRCAVPRWRLGGVTAAIRWIESDNEPPTRRFLDSFFDLIERSIRKSVNSVQTDIEDIEPRNFREIGTC